jgi:hypothetical protein
MYDTYRLMVGESVYYRYQVYSYQVKEAENTTQELKEARAMITTLQKGRCKDKARIRELSEVIHEQNFMLQHNDQYMFELENQLEVIAAPPSEPVSPRTEEGEDAKEIQGESRVESRPASS